MKKVVMLIVVLGLVAIGTSYFLKTAHKEVKPAKLLPADTLLMVELVNLEKSIDGFKSGKLGQKLNEIDLQSAGISRQKRAYCVNLSRKFIDKSINPKKFDQMTDEEIITELIQTKGIGRWTAQMFLIFSLAREDIFAPDDLGLRRAIMLIYGFDELPSAKDLEQFSIRWKPYRSYASLYLWRYSREH